MPAIQSKWMWADASLIGHGAAKYNPWRWSSLSNIDDTISGLRKEQPANQQRPVKARLFCDSQLPGGYSVLHLTYPSIEEAITGLQEYLGLQEHLVRRVADDVLWYFFCKHVADKSEVSVRWASNWNVICPPVWCSSEEGAQSLRQLTEQTQPVFLHIGAKLTSGSAVRYETKTETAIAAWAFLQELQELPAQAAQKSTISSKGLSVKDIGKRLAKQREKAQTGLTFVENIGSSIKVEDALAKRLAEQRAKVQTGTSTVKNVGSAADKSIKLEGTLAKRFAQQREKEARAESAVEGAGSTVDMEA